MIDVSFYLIFLELIIDLMTKLSLFCLIYLLLRGADSINISNCQSFLCVGIKKKNRHVREGKHQVLLANFYGLDEETSIHKNMLKYYRALWNDSIKFMKIMTNFINYIPVNRNSIRLWEHLR